MVEFKQDMPPPGGYAPIIYQRVPLRSGLPASVKLGLACLTTALGFYVVRLTKEEVSNDRIEMKCARVALTPMLLAEVDRMYLKQIRRNRDEEEKIMKDVKGWEVGKYKGTPVYLSLKPDEYFLASSSEFYLHADDDLKYFSFNVAKL